MMRRVLAATALAFSAVGSADDTTYIQVLGITQDAGYPQANCYQPHCNRA